MYKLKFGKSIAIAKEDFFDVIARAKAEGLESVDYDLCGKWNREDPEAENYRDYKKGLEAVRASGLYFNGVHIPFGRQWDFSELNEETRLGAVKAFGELAAVIDGYSPKCYIVHGSYEPVAPEERAAKLEALKKSLREMPELTKTTIAVEILPRTCLLNTSAEAIALVDSMESEQIKVCVDVNHFLQEKSEDGVLALGDRIVTTHISDHDYENERHWIPGEGKIDWVAVIDAFRKIGYDGAFNYEVGAAVAELRKNFDGLFEKYNSTVAQ